MKKPGFVSKFMDHVLAQLPVIGPHAEIEGELLLAGKKPLGWLSVPNPNLDPVLNRRELDLQRRLDDAVAEGKLKAADVVQETVDGAGRTRKDVFRHYAQPGREKDLAEVAAINTALFNRRPIDVDTNRTFGDYLGYRKRDQAYFKFMTQHMRQMPKGLVEALYDFNARVTQPAYQRVLLKDPSKLPLTMEQAAEAGDAGQQWRLGAMYAGGLANYPKDPAKAAEWYKKSADNGYLQAQLDVGRCYDEGIGVAKDAGQARKYYGLAAAGGNAFGQEMVERIDRVAAFERQQAQSALRRTGGPAL